MVNLIETGKKNLFCTDIEDELGDGTTIELPGVGTGMNLAKFEDKARQFLNGHFHPGCRSGRHTRSARKSARRDGG